MDIRHALKSNLSKITVNELQNTIESGIAAQDELILPGLGVLFEMYYQAMDSHEKIHCLTALSQLLA